MKIKEAVLAAHISNDDYLRHCINQLLQYKRIKYGII